MAAAIVAAERRTLPPLGAEGRAAQPARPLTEVEALHVQVRALEAALRLDDQLLLEHARTQAKLDRLRCAAGRLPLGRRLPAWVSRRLGR